MASPPIRSVVAATCLALGAALFAAPAQAASDSVKLQRWSSTNDFKAGTAKGVSVTSGSVKISKPAGTTSYADPYGSKRKRKFHYGTWTSPWSSTGFDARTVIPSWNVNAPSGTWIRVEMRGKSKSTTGSWDTIANWGYGSSGVTRASGPSQTDDISKLATDTVIANGSHRIRSWQIRVTLLRPTNSKATPRLDSVGAVAASFSTRSASVSKTTMTKTTELAVPRYSQMIHKGEFKQWGGGGVAWCSPTSTSMVLRYFKAGPKAADYTWSKYADSQVDHAARYTYDYRYKGNGNWPFNTAYAGRYGLDAFVTRLDNLRDAEAFIKKGIPVVASIAFGKGKLSGAPISSSAGHLLVINGFAEDGRVIVNDPAASTNSSVRRVYNRAQFEQAWLGGSGGVSNVMRPSTKPLPPDTARW